MTPNNKNSPHRKDKKEIKTKEQEDFLKEMNKKLKKCIEYNPNEDPNDPFYKGDNKREN